MVMLEERLRVERLTVVDELVSNLGIFFYREESIIIFISMRLSR